MKTIVIYDSVFGNTEKAAHIIGAKIEGAKVIKVSDASWDSVQGSECLIIGSPTRGFRPTPGITEFLKTIPSGGIEEIRTAVFDTRIDIVKVPNRLLTFLAKRFGYAADSIEKKVMKKGGFY